MTVQPYLHVKWFIGGVEAGQKAFGEIISQPNFLFWLMVTLVGLLLSAVFNERLQNISFIAGVHRLLDRGKPHITEILRVGLGIGILLQLVSATYLAPELHGGQWWIRLLLVIALGGLLTRRTLFVSGLALTALYIVAIIENGLFHTLDYAYYIGIIYFLLVSASRFKATATPVLYLFTGFSLAWVAFEKFTLPGLAINIMEKYQVPTFGFSLEDFVLISAFIEIGLAWSFIVGILNRFVSILVTLVFITTTTVFGFTEIIGHTIIHTLLVIFVIEGEGTFTTPFRFHKSPFLRTAFVLVNFCILLFVGMWVYTAIL